MKDKVFGEKRRRKIRELNDDISLNDYICELNSENPPAAETQLVNFNDPKFKKNVEFGVEYRHQSFEIHHLIKNGRKTWYGKCSFCTEQQKRNLFFAIGTEDCEIRVNLIARHARRNHGRIERKRKQNTDAGAGPSKRPKLVQISNESKAKIRAANSRLLTSGQVKSLNIFEKKEFLERDEAILASVNVDVSVAKQFVVSANTTRRDLFNKSESNRQEIRAKVPIVAKKGGIGFHKDHKSINRHAINSQAAHVLGGTLTITDTDGSRAAYLCGLEETETETHLEAIEKTNELLEDYGLTEIVENGLVTMNTDYALHGAAKKISFNNSVDINHSIDCLIKRSVNDLMKNYSAEAEEEFLKLKKFALKANKNLTKRELRLLPEETFSSLNDLLKSKETSPIPMYTDVRFRSLGKTVATIHNARTIINEILEDSQNPNNRHISDVPNTQYIQALNEMFTTLFDPLINYADSMKNSQAGDYVCIIENVLNWACKTDPSDCNPYKEALKKSMVAACMQQLTGKYVVNGKIEKSKVRRRLLANELVIMFGTMHRRKMELSKIKYILRQGNYLIEAEMVKEFCSEKKFSEIAREQIRKYDASLNGECFVQSDESDTSGESGDNSPAETDFADNPSMNSVNSTLGRSPIEKEMDAWQKSSKSLYCNFKLFAKNRDWKFRKSETGFLPQNSHMQAYWSQMAQIYPRLSKIMNFVLKTPCSSSCLERVFSSISLNTAAVASSRDVEYLENVNQVNPNSDRFFEILQSLYEKCSL